MRSVADMYQSNHVKQIKCSELGYPGVEIVTGPRGGILHTTRASQLPYNANSYVFVFLHIVNDLLEMGFPGVEMISRPRGSILHHTRAFQVPYKA